MESWLTHIFVGCIACMNNGCFIVTPCYGVLYCVPSEGAALYTPNLRGTLIDVTSQEASHKQTGAFPGCGCDEGFSLYEQSMGFNVGDVELVQRKVKSPKGAFRSHTGIVLMAGE